MKVRIIKYKNAGETPPKYTFKAHRGDKGKSGKWNASEYSDEELHQIAEKYGYTGPDNAEDFQKWAWDHPELGPRIKRAHKIYGETNAGTPFDNKLGVRWPFGLKNDGTPNYSDPEYTKLPDSEKAQYTSPDGNNYSMKEDGFKKKPYQREKFPIYQAFPEMMGFASSLNTYNYQTPDYQHWEMNPNKLNIQPQIQSIDSSLKAITDTTTGNPQIDSARKVGAFTQSLTAKQQAYANKQNFDAEKEYQAAQFNINARTQEQNLDVQAMNHIYNEYMPLAKDYAAGERIAAVDSLTKKYAEHLANQNKIKRYSDAFNPNIEIGPDGETRVVGGKDELGLGPLYTVDPKTGMPSDKLTSVKPTEMTTSTPSNPISIDEKVSPIIKKQQLSPNAEITLPKKIVKKPKSLTNFYDPNSYVPESPVRISNRYGSLIK